MRMKRTLVALYNDFNVELLKDNFFGGIFKAFCIDFSCFDLKPIKVVNMMNIFREKSPPHHQESLVKERPCLEVRSPSWSSALSVPVQA